MLTYKTDNLNNYDVNYHLTKSVNLDIRNQHFMSERRSDFYLSSSNGIDGSNTTGNSSTLKGGQRLDSRSNISKTPFRSRNFKNNRVSREFTNLDASFSILNYDGTAVASTSNNNTGTTKKGLGRHALISDETMITTPNSTHFGSESKQSKRQRYQHIRSRSVVGSIRDEAFQEHS